MNTVNINSGGNVQFAVGSDNVVQIQGRDMLRESELKEYVAHLVQSRMTGVEDSDVWELADEFFGVDLNQKELDHVFRLLGSAKVEVEISWPS